MKMVLGLNSSKNQNEDTEMTVDQHIHKALKATNSKSLSKFDMRNDQNYTATNKTV